MTAALQGPVVLPHASTGPWQQMHYEDGPSHAWAGAHAPPDHMHHPHALAAAHAAYAVHGSGQQLAMHPPFSHAVMHTGMHGPPQDAGRADSGRDASTDAGEEAVAESKEPEAERVHSVSTRLVGDSRFITQAIFLQVVKGPAGQRPIQQLFDFWRSRPNTSRSTIISLSLEQHDTMYALAGCSDVAYQPANVSQEVRAWLRESQGVDRTSFNIWFKNRRRKPSRAKAGSKKAAAQEPGAETEGGGDNTKPKPPAKPARGRGTKRPPAGRAGRGRGPAAAPGNPGAPGQAAAAVEKGGVRAGCPGEATGDAPMTAAAAAAAAAAAVACAWFQHHGGAPEAAPRAGGQQGYSGHGEQVPQGSMCMLGEHPHDTHLQEQASPEAGTAMVLGQLRADAEPWRHRTANAGPAAGGIPPHYPREPERMYAAAHPYPAPGVGIAPPGRGPCTKLEHGQGAELSQYQQPSSTTSVSGAGVRGFQEPSGGGDSSDTEPEASPRGQGGRAGWAPMPPLQLLQGEAGGQAMGAGPMGGYPQVAGPGGQGAASANQPPGASTRPPGTFHPGSAPMAGWPPYGRPHPGPRTYPSSAPGTSSFHSGAEGTVDDTEATGTETWDHRRRPISPKLEAGAHARAIVVVPGPAKGRADGSAASGEVGGGSADGKEAGRKRRKLSNSTASLPHYTHHLPHPLHHPGGAFPGPHARGAEFGQPTGWGGPLPPHAGAYPGGLPPFASYPPSFGGMPLPGHGMPSPVKRSSSGGRAFPPGPGLRGGMMPPPSFPNGPPAPPGSGSSNTSSTSGNGSDSNSKTDSGDESGDEQPASGGMPWGAHPPPHGFAGMYPYPLAPSWAMPHHGAAPYPPHGHPGTYLPPPSGHIPQPGGYAPPSAAPRLSKGGHATRAPTPPYPYPYGGAPPGFPPMPWYPHTAPPYPGAPHPSSSTHAPNPGEDVSSSEDSEDAESSEEDNGPDAHAGMGTGMMAAYPHPGAQQSHSYRAPTGAGGMGAGYPGGMGPPYPGMPAPHYWPRGPQGTPMYAPPPGAPPFATKHSRR